MANSLYNLARENLLLSNGTPLIDYDTGTQRLFVVETAYTVNIDTHDFFNDITSGLANGSSGGVTFADGPALTSKAAPLGIADAADTIIVACANGAVACSYVVLIQANSTDANSPLFVYWDTMSGLPVTPNGQDLTVIWDNGANKIFRL